MNRNLDLWISSPHDKTRGATYNGASEEFVFEPIVLRIVDILNNAGFGNVYSMGVNGHEMDQDDDGTNYGAIVSLHGNVGNAMMLYCQNANRINDITNAYGVFCNNNGIAYSGAIERCDLDMLNGVGERYLIECLDMRDARQVVLFSNVEYIAQSLAEILANVFYGESLGGDFTPPNPTPEQPTGDSPEQTDGYGLVAEYNAPRGRITSQDADRIIGFNDVLRTSDSGEGLYQGEYFESTDTEYLVRLQGDDNYIMRQSATSGLFFAVGTWLYDAYGRRVVDELYSVSFSV